MASTISIQFDPDDLEAKHLLEGMAAMMDRRTAALAVDQPDPHGARPAPVPPLYVDEDDEEDDDEEDENPAQFLTASTAIDELASYLSCEATPQAVIAAVKDLGSQLQDAKAAK